MFALHFRTLCVVHSLWELQHSEVPYAKNRSSCGQFGALARLSADRDSRRGSKRQRGPVTGKSLPGRDHRDVRP